MAGLHSPRVTGLHIFACDCRAAGGPGSQNRSKDRQQTSDAVRHCGSGCSGVLAAWAASQRPMAGDLPAREHRHRMSRMRLAHGEVSAPGTAGMPQPAARWGG